MQTPKPFVALRLQPARSGQPSFSIEHRQTLQSVVEHENAVACKSRDPHDVPKLSWPFPIPPDGDGLAPGKRDYPDLRFLSNRHPVIVQQRNILNFKERLASIGSACVGNFTWIGQGSPTDGTRGKTVVINAHTCTIGRRVQPTTTLDLGACGDANPPQNTEKQGGVPDYRRQTPTPFS